MASESKPVLILRDPEIVQRDIKNFISIALKENPNHSSALYQKLGAKLVCYVIAGLNGGMLTMANLAETFVFLGCCASFIVHEMNDAGLIYGESSWLGAINPRDVTRSDFEFVDLLANFSAIKACNKTERLVLYNHYLDGLKWGLLKFYGKYGNPSCQ